jgi:hypothetical protein
MGEERVLITLNIGPTAFEPEPQQDEARRQIGSQALRTRRLLAHGGVSVMLLEGLDKVWGRVCPALESCVR